MLDVISIILVFISFLIFGAGILVANELPKHIDKKKVRELEDVSILGRGHPPSDKILTNKGMRSKRLSYALFIFSFLLIGMIVLLQALKGKTE